MPAGQPAHSLRAMSSGLLTIRLHGRFSPIYISGKEDDAVSLMHLIGIWLPQLCAHGTIQSVGLLSKARDTAWRNAGLRLSMPGMTDETCRARSNRCTSHQSSRVTALAAQDVTKAQAKERANARNLHNQHTLDRYIVPGSPPTKSLSQSAAGKPYCLS